MNVIQYRHSSVGWGPRVQETYVLHLEEKVYAHYTDGVRDASFPLPDDLVETIRNFFEPIYRDFPGSQAAFDAPMWTLSIDDKTCTRIAAEEFDPLYSKISFVFKAFKNAH